MRISVLGPLRVSDGDRELDPGPARQRALLALLVVADGRTVGVDQLVAELWGQAAPPKVMASLQVHVANLRRVLEPDRTPRSRPTRLVTRPPGYALLRGGLEVDATLFAEEVAQGRRLLASDPAAAGATLARGLDRWQGEAYAGLADSSDALTAEAARLGELRLTAVEDLAQARLGSGDHAQVVAELEPFVRAHPLRERGWWLLALALYRGQRQGDALEALRRARAHLADELGVDPSPELRELEAAVLAQDPALAAPVTTASALSDADAVGVGTGRPGAADAAAPVGRDEVLAAIADAVTAAAGRRGRIVVVTGEPGIGKTAVVRTAVARARAEGAITGWGSWDEERAAAALRPWGDAVAGLVPGRSAAELEDLLGAQAGDLAPLLPVLQARDTRRDAEMDSETAGLRLADSLARLVRHVPDDRAAVLVLDDLHWADADSLRLLRRFGPVVAGLPLVLVVTSRSADSELSEDLVATTAVLARLDPLRLPLAGLVPADVARLVLDRTGLEPDDGLVRAISERTDGNPFYISEILRLVDARALTARTVNELDVPDGVRDVVRRRLTAFTEAGRGVLAVAAVFGRRFAVDVVAEAGQLSQDDVDDALDLALLHDLVQPDDQPGTLRFSHALVREAIYAQVPAHRRPRMHARVAQALERLRIGSVDSHLAELVLHYRLAGPLQARACWTHAVRAAGVAEERRAYDDAVRYYDVAIESIGLDPQSATIDEATALAGRGRALRRQALVAQAWRDLARAARLTVDHGDASNAAAIALQIADGSPWHWRDYTEYDLEAVALWQRLLDALPPESAGLRARTTAALALEHFHVPGAEARCTELAELAVELARRTGDEEDLLRVLQIVHIAFERPTLFDRRMATADEQVAVASRLGHDLGHALCQRGTDRFEAGRLPEAEADLDRAWELGTAGRDVAVILVSGWARALFLPARGDLVGAAAAIGEVDEIQQSVNMTGRGIGDVQRTVLALWAGRLAELEDFLAAATAQAPAFRDFYLLSVLAARGPARTAELAGRWSDQPEISFDYLWIALTVLRARLWAHLGDAEAVAALRSTLSPYAGRWVVGGGSTSFDGMVDETLARLARAAGDVDEAVSLLRTAVASYEERGLWALLARAARELAAALRQRDAADPEASDLDARADELAGRYGLVV